MSAEKLRSDGFFWFERADSVFDARISVRKSPPRGLSGNSRSWRNREFRIDLANSKRSLAPDFTFLQFLLASPSGAVAPTGCLAEWWFQKRVGRPTPQQSFFAIFKVQDFYIGENSRNGSVAYTTYYCIGSSSLNAQKTVRHRSIRSESAKSPEHISYPMAILSAEIEPWCNKNMPKLASWVTAINPVRAHPSWPETEAARVTPFAAK